VNIANYRVGMRMELTSYIYDLLPTKVYTSFVGAESKGNMIETFNVKFGYVGMSIVDN
jgi:hypothetical protein